MLGYITKPNPGIMINPLHPLSRKLVGYWLFNEGSGSQIYDISWHGNHGTMSNMSPNSQDSGWGSSKFGGGLQFDGIDDYVNVGSSNNLSIINAITIGAWIKVSGNHAGGYGGIVQGASRHINRNRILIKNNGDVLIQFFIDGSMHNFDINTNFLYDVWYFIVYEYNGIQELFFVDGIQINSRNQTGLITTGTSDMLIGVGAPTKDDNYYFNGSIDYVLVYNHALSVEEIKQLYHDPFCSLLQSPIRRYSVIIPPI